MSGVVTLGAKCGLLRRYFKFRYKHVAKHNVMYGGTMSDVADSCHPSVRHEHVDMVDLTFKDALAQVSCHM